MWNFVDRLMIAARAAYTAFREPDLMPETQHGWGTTAGRWGRYAVLRSLYNNNLYWQSNPIGQAFKETYGLVDFIDGIYSPYFRLVETITAKTMGGTIDWESLKTGAVPVTDADDRLIKALLQTFKWSNWQAKKSLYARTAAMMGDVGLWVVDDLERQKVRMEVLDPARIKKAEFDDVSNVKSCEIEYLKEWWNPSRRCMELVTYRMEAPDNTLFRTFKDDKPYGWHKDADGNPMPEWENPYGFIPLAMVQFRDLGLHWGGSCLHAATSKFNAANDLASIRNAGARKAADPPFYATGVTTNADLQVPDKDRDDTPIIGGPKDSNITSLAPNIDFAGVNAAIDSMREELEADAPELSLRHLQEIGGDLSGIAIRNMFGDAIGRMIEAMGNLDGGVIRASKMAVSIGGYRGYEGFQGYDLDSYADNELEFQIKPRPLFEDGFTPQQRVEVIKALPENPVAAEYILVNELQMSEEDARKIIDAQKAIAAQKQAQQAAQFGQRQGDENPVTVQPNPHPQLPAGQGDDDVQAEVSRIVQELGLVA